MAALQSRVSELTKENTVLKRAVAIQQSRWQEAVAANKQQAAQAEGAVSQLQVWFCGRITLYKPLFLIKMQIFKKTFLYFQNVCG